MLECCIVTSENKSINAADRYGGCKEHSSMSSIGMLYESCIYSKISGKMCYESDISHDDVGHGDGTVKSELTRILTEGRTVNAQRKRLV